MCTAVPDSLHVCTSARRMVCSQSRRTASLASPLIGHDIISCSHHLWLLTKSEQARTRDGREEGGGSCWAHYHPMDGSVWRRCGTLFSICVTKLAAERCCTESPKLRRLLTRSSLIVEPCNVCHSSGRGVILSLLSPPFFALSWLTTRTNPNGGGGVGCWAQEYIQPENPGKFRGGLPRQCSLIFNERGD